MLLSSDAPLVQHDSALPGLALLFDPSALLAALRLRAPVPELLHSIQSLQIAYIRYKPPTSCIVSYRAVSNGDAPHLKSSDSIQTADASIVLCAVAYSPEATEKLRKASEKPSVEAVPPRVALEQGIVVSFFPDDRDLKSLAHLADEQTRIALLRELLPQHPALWHATPRVLAYKPARRCVLQLQDEQARRGVVLRFYEKTEFEKVRKKASLVAPGALLRLPQLLEKSTRHAVLALEWLPGHPLNRVLEAAGETLGGACEAQIEQVGAALAQLHAQEGEGLLLRTRETEARALLAAASGVSAVCPHLARRATALAHRLSAQLNERPFAPCTIHGDFYAPQVLLPQSKNEPVALLDLDEVSCGDPALDIGNFVAHLERAVLRGALSAPCATQCREALLTGYNRATQHNISLPDVILTTATGLMRLAPEPFRTHQPQWPDQIETILARVELLLEESTVTRLLTGNKSFQTPAATESSTRFDDSQELEIDSTMPFLAQALNADEAARHLLPLLPHATRLVDVRLARHKAGRRCLIEYDFERGNDTSQPFTVIAKVRAKGLDKSTFNLVRTLRQSGWTEDSSDGIAVPEPLGTIPEWRLWLMRKVPGRTAAALLNRQDEKNGIAVAQRAADVVCKLHRSGVPARRRHTIEDELRLLHERLPMVAQLYPSWESRLNCVLEACDKLGAGLPSSLLCGIHRDFYPDQVLVEALKSGHRLWMLDLDLYSEGDPALDAGNFVGHLIESGLRTGGDPNALQEQAAAFQERFLEQSPNCSREAIEAYTTLTLVRHIFISTQIKGRATVTQSLLELCEERLK